MSTGFRVQALTRAAVMHATAIIGSQPVASASAYPALTPQKIMGKNSPPIQPPATQNVWMSHGVAVTKAPQRFTVRTLA
nr:hypothetical protein [Pseudoscardovia radai]